MLSKLASLTLCRSIQLLAMLARGDAAKDLEILVLGNQLGVLGRQLPCPSLEPTDRALLAAISRVLRAPTGHACSSGRNAAALASAVDGTLSPEILDVVREAATTVERLCDRFGLVSPTEMR